MKQLYIAGPYSAPTTWEIDRNIERARRYGAFVMQHVNAYAIIPHSNTAHMDGLRPHDFWLDGTLEALRRCDGAVFIAGWRESKGARREHEVCLDRDIPTFYTNVLEHPGDDYLAVDALKKWFNGLPGTRSEIARLEREIERLRRPLIRS